MGYLDELEKLKMEKKYNDALKDTGEKLEIDFSKKILSLGEIKNILGQVKI